MYQLLIVDDEQAICEGIKEILPWEEYGIEVIGFAFDGREALKKIEEWMPQIVMTDIKMPNMDGLALLKEIKKRELGCRVIVLSGFHEYDLVRKAMKLGAVDYILKPSDREELAQVISELIDNMENEILDRFQGRETLEVVRNNILNRLIRNKITPTEVRNKDRILNMELNGSEFRVLTAKMIHDEEEETWKLFQAYTELADLLQASGAGIVFLGTNNRIHLILQNHPLDSFLRREIESWLRKVKEEADTELVVAVGNQVNSLRNISQSYQSSLKALEYRFVLKNEKILYYDDIESLFKNTKEFTGIDAEVIKRLLAQGKTNEALGQMKEFYHNVSEKQIAVPIDVMRNMGMEIAMAAFGLLQKINPQNDDYTQEKEQVLKAIWTARHIEELENAVSTCIQWCGRTVGTENKQYSVHVSETLRVIRKNFRNPELSLQYMADRLKVNAAYLGRIFKKETGDSFTEYLNQVRVDEAVRLLRGTNYKGAKISEMVGFSNYNYFYIVFKKIVGKRPMEIRRDKDGNSF